MKNVSSGPFLWSDTRCHVEVNYLFHSQFPRSTHADSKTHVAMEPCTWVRTLSSERRKRDCCREWDADHETQILWSWNRKYLNSTFCIQQWCVFQSLYTTIVTPVNVHKMAYLPMSRPHKAFHELAVCTTSYKTAMIIVHYHQHIPCHCLLQTRQQARRGGSKRQFGDHTPQRIRQIPSQLWGWEWGRFSEDKRRDTH